MNSIKKDRKIEVTRQWAQRFEKDIALWEKPETGATLHPQLKAAYLESLKSQLIDLREELANLEKS
jgi:hypothetical protein